MSTRGFCQKRAERLSIKKAIGSLLARRRRGYDPIGPRICYADTSAPRHPAAASPKQSDGTPFATQVKANGEDVKVVQESLRHANSRITLDTYTQATTTAKRQAQTRVVSIILPEQIQTPESGGGK